MVHLALQTGLPVVPIVIHGAHQAWRSDSLSVHGGRIRVEVLPAIDTSGWSADGAAEAAEEIHEVFRSHLPADQRPASPVLTEAPFEPSPHAN